MTLLTISCLSCSDDSVLNLNTPATVSLSSRRGNKFSNFKTDSRDGLVTKRKLVYNTARSHSPIMSPGEPASKNANGVGIIEISDSEDDEKTSQRIIHNHGNVNAVPVNNFSDDDEVFVCCSLKRLSAESSRNEQLKRKRVLNFVSPDSDSDDIPIGMSLNKNLTNQDQKSSNEDEVETVLTDGTFPSVLQRKRRLISLSQRYESSGSGSHFTMDSVSDDCLEDTESEGESLGGFIVKSSDSISSSSSPTGDGNDASFASLQSDSDVNTEFWRNYF